MVMVMGESLRTLHKGLVHGWSINLLGGGSSFARQQGFFLNLGRWLWS
uniref:Uncharacterized protein n=1 Tax=Vitis vinifera TaxID=29760 RepID=F6HET0_VITVI